MRPSSTAAARRSGRARDPRNAGNVGEGTPRAPSDLPDRGEPANQALDGALRTIERHVNDGHLNAIAADGVDECLRGPDKALGLDAAYVEAAGAPAYERAFSKLIRYGDGAVLRM